MQSDLISDPTGFFFVFVLFGNLHTSVSTRYGDALDLLKEDSPLLEDRDVIHAAVVGGADIPKAERDVEEVSG